MGFYQSSMPKLRILDDGQGQAIRIPLVNNHSRTKAQKIRHMTKKIGETFDGDELSLYITQNW